MTSQPQSLLLLTMALALLPVAVTMGTSYVKVSVVLGILRQGLGTQSAPSSLVIAGLSLALSALVMQPVITETQAKLPKLSLAQLEKMPVNEIGALAHSLSEPWRRFLKDHAGSAELSRLQALATRDAASAPIAPTEPSLVVLIGAFLVTELKEAFCIGFLLLLPFLVIDTVVANLAVGLGLTMLNPSMITLPLKLLLFYSADGWLGLSDALVRSYSAAGG
jgi:type III secretion protein R